MSEVEDPALLAMVARGDLGALRTLYDRHAPWLAARLNRRCNDTEVVADVLQDAFVGIWRGAGSWRGDGEATAWLWGIAARCLVARLRRRHALLMPLESTSSFREMRAGRP